MEREQGFTIKCGGFEIGGLKINAFYFSADNF